MEEETKGMFAKCLDDILKNKKFKILKYDFPYTQFTGGYVSKMVNIKATVEKDGNTEILDLLVKSNQITTDDIFTDAYLNEMNVYSRIVPCFNKFAEEHETDRVENVPRCYGVSSSDQHHIVVLENLKSKGFRVRDFAPLDMDHIKLLLKSYAKWHAFSFALKDQQPEVFKKLEKQKLGLEGFQLTNAVVTSFEQQIDFAIGWYEKERKPIVLDKLKSLKRKYRNLYEEFMANKDEEYVAITHADAWNNNFMFKYNEESLPTDVRIVDWQTSILGSPLIDVAQVLFFCCCREELEHMDDLLKLYHSTLSEKISQLGSDPAKCFPWEACLKSFKCYAALGIAGAPFLVRMYFSAKYLDESNDHAEIPDDGDFSTILGEEISDPEAFFERLNSILELCIECDLI